MQTNPFKTILNTAVRAGSILLFATVAALGQQQINLTAGPATATLPDGSTVPMWGYSCGAAVAGSTATCAALNTNVPAGGWSPVVITVPTGQSLTINLTNNLSFLPVGTGTANSVPTSLVIVGQVGGGLGTSASTTASPNHPSQVVTWSTVGTTPLFTPPPQGPRVQSFSTEVATGATTSLTWATPKAGTYLLESGTHPSIQGPMGLYGMLVVTTAPVGTSAGTGYPGVTYNAEVPMLLSELDAVQNAAVNTAVNTPGFIEMTMRTFGDQVGSVTVTNGGSGYTSNPAVTFAGAAGSSGATATATVGAVVTGITVTIPGSGYSAAPGVTISDTPPGTGTGATAVAIVTFAVGSIAVTSGGSGYAAGDVINLTGGGGSGATAVVGSVDTAGVIQTVTVTNGGSGYTTAPTVSSITSAAGTGAVLAPALAATGVVSKITVTNGGSGYTAPTVAIAGTGGAMATASIAGTPGVVYSVTVTNGGAGYHLAPSVTIAAPTTGTQATATASVNQACTGGLPCYPPAVNYTPLYYMINGVSFNKTSPLTSLFPTAPANPGTGTVLVRLVNAGLRMHVPSIVGSQTGAGTTPPNGFSIIAEDGNPLPGVPKVQNEVFMAAGKTYDVMINTPTSTTAPALPIYDRELSLSGNAIARDAGMLAYIGINGAGLPVTSGTGVFAAAVANPDTYNSVVPCAVAPCTALTVSDPSKGVIANDVNVYGVKVSTPPTKGTLTLNANGTFIYVPNAGWTSPDTFMYQANGTGPTTTVTLSAATVEAASGITCPSSITYSASMATYLAVKTPGVLSGCKDAAGYPLTATAFTATGLTVLGDANGGFTATAPSAGAYSFTFQAKNSQGTLTAPMTVMLTFPTPSGLSVTVVDGNNKTTQISDFRWIIEEDRSFFIDPNCTSNPPPAGCPTAASGIVPTLGVNFHTSYMPYIAQGCTGPKSCEFGQTVIDPVTGLHGSAVCDIGNGVCRPDTGNGTTAGGSTWVNPSQVAWCPSPQTIPATTNCLDPAKRYYVSVLPGDAADPFYGAGSLGHGMGGAPIAAACKPVPPATTCTGTFAPVTVLSQPSPYPPGKLAVFVFEDDFPLNGEHDSGGGIDVLATNEPGLGGFQIHLWDAFGGNGDFTGQMSYDMFNQPLVNSLAGTIDPTTGLDACPVSANPRQGTIPDPNNPTGPRIPDPTQTGITGMIVTCPRFESDGITLSPLAGQAVVANLMPGRWGVIATPGADRIARGEEWLQTNTLDGQKAHDVFTRIGEPNYFQEFGPASWHVTVGFANPKIINARLAGVCNGSDPNLPGQNCTPGNTLTGRIVGQRLSRTPDERLYGSGSRDTYFWTQCYVSVGDTDGEDFAFTKCNADGTFTFTGLPNGDWRITTFDQWNDQLVDGLSTPARLGSATSVCPGAGSSQNLCNMGDIAATQWQTNLYTRTFVDDNRNGTSQANEAGIPLVNVAVRLRDGSIENLLGTDFTGTADFNETFPLFSWYTVETDVTRYKTTGTHVVYDGGGPADGTSDCGTSSNLPCGNSVIGKFLANTLEKVSVPTNLRVPGAVYCADADCTGKSIQNGPGTSDPPSVCTTATTGQMATTCSTALSTGRIDPPWVGMEGWQGFPGQNNFIEFGKAPYYPGENGGIHGHVDYASTRPFDDPQMLVQTQWEPLVPNVTINLYQEGFAADTVTPTLRLVDTTKTSSFDDWAQGFRADNGLPNMSCPGQGTNTGVLGDLFYFSLYNQPSYLDLYNNQHNGTPLHNIPNNSQFKCYDGMHNWNQIQPAPYDGAYQFPSVTATDPATGKPTGTNCHMATSAEPWGCIPDPVPATIGVEGADPLRAGLPMLPMGKYVVEVVLPPGFELVKEEDKNILIGDNFIAPVTQEFGALGNVFILPDQASIAGTFALGGSGYNANNAQNPTQSFGAIPENGIVPGFVPEPIWPCVGEARIVPDYISLFPQSHQVAPFAGATRNLCDRKEVTLSDQMGAIAKFFIYTSTHIASKFTGGITDDFTSEFDPFAPTFGEKFSPANLPVSLKDWTGAEISRVYSDHWGSYDGMTYSTWEVNPPNPTGYSPTMMVFCMNDPGTGPTPDPLFNPQYSQFCYELPFMPGTTQYLDTPVVPTAAFAGAGYNNPDCNYPALTPAISEVDGDGVGPWISAAGPRTLTITALGDQMVPNYAYSGPSATTAPYNQKTITRHYGFGSGGTVKIGGFTIPAANVTWGDSSIVLTVPATNTIPNCAIQQQAQYLGSSAQCGELVITRADNGLQSIDTVTVTIGGKTPTHIPASGTIQSAIDAAAPGDLLIVDPTCTAPTGPVACTTTGATHSAATHQELVIMWKPVRLQGVGAASSIINANTHPAGKLDGWRAQVNCLFGLAINGQPYSANSPTATPVPPASRLNPYDPTGAISCPGTGWNYFNADGGSNDPQVDRLPLEGIVGWDATVNGNLAQLLQEPSLMGAYEGAGITVLSKGLRFPAGGFIFGNGPDSGTVATESQLPLGTVPLSNTDADCLTTAGGTGYASNFQCNPSSIDGLSVTNSSQGGGGIFLHAWAHNMEIANNRVYNNTGTLTGGIVVGQGEAPDALLNGNNGDPVGFDQQPWTCYPGGITGTFPNQTQNVSIAGLPTGTQLPYCYDTNVNVHNNYVTNNSSIGDEVFTGTPAGAGGVTFCIGADYYKFNYNWVCGNMSTGDGGGLTHAGFIWHGDIEHNTIVFNQSINPTIPANGGGIVVMGAPPDGTLTAGPECGSVTDVDCAAGLSDGVGPELVINANLLQGNAAESGSGGGIALQNVNGSDVTRFPTGPTPSATSPGWNHITVTNNIIANNVAGWDGAGISMLDALDVDFINNTVINNNSTASAGILFNTVGAPVASTHGNNCTTTATTSCPQPSGLVSIPNSSPLTAGLPATITCPPGHFSTVGGGTANNGSCRLESYPLLANNVLWQNSSYYIGVGALGTGTQNQQHVVSLFNAFTANQVTSQHATGECVTGLHYWDIGVRGDTGPGNHAGGAALNPQYSVLTSLMGGYSTTNLTTNPQAVSPYCNGSRIPPEACGNSGCGYNVPPGIADATVPNPIFNLTPVATVDEGNNWVNMRWGPLSLTNPQTGVLLGNYALVSSSAAIDAIPASAPTFAIAPTTDFFGNPRPDPPSDGRIDIGAVEFQGNNTGFGTPALTSITPNTGLRGTTFGVTITGTNLSSTATTVIVTPPAGGGITISGVTAGATQITATFAISTTATLGAWSVTVSTPGGTSNALTFTVIGATLTSINPASGERGSTNLPVTLTGTNLTGATAVTVSGTGVTCSVTTPAPTATTINALCTITSTAGLTARNVSATTLAGTTNILTGAFTVTGPTLTAINPTAGLRGSTNLPVTLTGTDLTGATAVTVSGTGVTCSITTPAPTDTTINALCTITTTAPLGARNVTATTPNGPTPVNPAVTFTVQGATLTAINPTSGLRGSTNLAVTLTGTNLTGATAVTVSGTGVTCSITTPAPTATTINALCTITTTAGLGARNVSATTPAGTTNILTGAFTVQGATLTSIAPTTGTHGTIVPVTLTGTNLTGATAVTIAGGGVTCAITGTPTATTINANCTIASAATLGARNVSATTPAGTTNILTGAFTVN